MKLCLNGVQSLGFITRCVFWSGARVSQLSAHSLARPWERWRFQRRETRPHRRMLKREDAALLLCVGHIHPHGTFTVFCGLLRAPYCSRWMRGCQFEMRVDFRVLDVIRLGYRGKCWSGIVPSFSICDFGTRRPNWFETSSQRHIPPTGPPVSSKLLIESL